MQTNLQLFFLAETREGRLGLHKVAYRWGRILLYVLVLTGR